MSIESVTPPLSQQTRASRWPAFRLYLAVAAGGVIGSLLRWFADLVLLASAGDGFPWGTLFVNITGSFVIGFYAELTAPGGRRFAGPHERHFVTTGLCGGYTTFSMFSLDTLRFLQSGTFELCLLYVALSITSWLGAVWLGEVVAKSFNKLKGG